MGRRHDEFVLKGGAAREPRHRDLGEPTTDRHLDLYADKPATGRVHHRDKAGRAFPHYHPAVRNRECDGEGVATDQVDRGDDDEHRTGEGDCHQLHPAETVTEREGSRHHEEHRPAERCDDGGDAPKPRDEDAINCAEESHERDDRVGEEAGAITHDTSAGVGETDGGCAVGRIEVRGR